MEYGSTDESLSGYTRREPETGTRLVVGVIPIADEKSRFYKPSGAQRGSWYSTSGTWNHSIYSMGFFRRTPAKGIHKVTSVVVPVARFVTRGGVRIRPRTVALA